MAKTVPPFPVGCAIWASLSDHRVPAFFDRGSGLPQSWVWRCKFQRPANRRKGCARCALCALIRCVIVAGERPCPHRGSQKWGRSRRPHSRVSQRRRLQWEGGWGGGGCRVWNAEKVRTAWRCDSNRHCLPLQQSTLGRSLETWKKKGKLGSSFNFFFFTFRVRA